jgi:hypothetical protein
MITERELRRIAGRFNLGVGQTEHEYALLCVLDALSQTPTVFDASTPLAKSGHLPYTRLTRKPQPGGMRHNATQTDATPDVQPDNAEAQRAQRPT